MIRMAITPRIITKVFLPRMFFIALPERILPQRFLVKMKHVIMPPRMSDLNLPDADPCLARLHPKAVEGLELFNAGRYFEAHESLEAAWRQETQPIRELYRGILQAAVVYLHVTRRNYAGAAKVYHRMLRWLTPWPETCRGIRIRQLRLDLAAVYAALQQLEADRMTEFDLTLLKPVVYTVE
jgi:predicted metal-dependent hydrolase